MTTQPHSKPLPNLTFSHMASLPVRAAIVDIVSHYDPVRDSKDVSAEFPVSPDTALRRYVEHRFQPAGHSGRVQFMIENMFIHESVEAPEGGLVNWMQLNRRNIYDVEVKLTIKIMPENISQETEITMVVERSLAIPQHYSLAEKDAEKFKFMEMLMDDVDDAVVNALKDKVL